MEKHVDIFGMMMLKWIYDKYCFFMKLFWLFYTVQTC